MLSLKGFEFHLNNIEHQTHMYNTYKLEVFLNSVESSKQVLINNFIEQQKIIEQYKITMGSVK